MFERDFDSLITVQIEIQSDEIGSLVIQENWLSMMVSSTLYCQLLSIDINIEASEKNIICHFVVAVILGLNF